MTSLRIWLCIGGVIAGAALALALGVSLGSLLIVAALLACPIAMYFGMRGMGTRQESEHVTIRSHMAVPDAEREPTEPAHQMDTPTQKEKP